MARTTPNDPPPVDARPLYGRIAALYLGISALQRHKPEARFKCIGPRLFSGLFILGDFICLSFIGCGGSLAAIYAWSPIG
ncbi:hypothetical protein AB0A67_39160, partial [Streptomyces eurythermus]